MTRIALLLFSSLIAACTVGKLPANGDGGTGIDAMADLGCVNRVTPASTAHDHGGGVTNAGLDCQQGGCHAAGGAGPTFQFSGTIYKADGTTPNVGATIRIKPVGGGAETVMVSDEAGNFSLALDPANPVPLPAVTDTTACPKVTEMVGDLVVGANGGACNNCHRTPGGTTARITLAD